MRLGSKHAPLNAFESLLFCSANVALMKLSESAY